MPSHLPTATRPESAAGRVRIIGGRWRGRVLRFDAAARIRPTPDRVRETLFNWLQPELEGRACLDLCAGSGALALEALSRGAASVVAVEHDARTAAALQQTRTRLGAAALTVECKDACAFLDQDPRRFDLVFLDPPYQERALRDALLMRLHARCDQDPQMLVYLEWPNGADGDANASAAPAPLAAGGWCAHRNRERSYGGVRFGLYRPAGPASANGAAS